ncbi:P-loop containing nucleoside triphosphate hydrolase protein [Lipomyces orientalis]|uniref:P-loop containing nucleoside triphosphate hydrolase protein n=1 Tax=Lipomyces orientalis TaxID=1233043 RepID=A0ACC3TYC8_9ASCO
MAEKDSLLSSSDDADEKRPLNDKTVPVSDASSISEESNKGYSTIAGLDDEFSGLSDHDAETLRQQVHIATAPASFFRLFRYADKKDYAILALGVLVSIGEGLMRPLLAIVFGAATQEFTDLPEGSMMSFFNGSYYNQVNSTFASHNNTGWVLSESSYSAGDEYESYTMDNSEFVRNVSQFAVYFLLLGVGVTVMAYTKSFVFIDRADVLSARIREQYLAATLRQNIGFFDKLGPGEITTRISADTALLQDAMSEKVAYIISHSTTFIVSVIIAYSRSYILSSIVIGNVIMIILVSYFGSKIITKFSARSQEGYSVGGSLAEETVSSVRNVQAFGIQDRMAQAYDKFLDVSEKWSIRAGYASGLRSGLTFMFAMSIDALVYWQGVQRLTEQKVEVSTMLTVIFTLSQGAFAFTIISPYLTSISIGLAASTKIFATIDRKSAIDSSSEDGDRLEEVNGDIELRNVRFIYPSRPNVTVLRDFSLKIPAGKTVALVGASGSGKSTIVGLIERFYNPLAGEILLDGHNILDLNTRWLRQRVALVSQEPSLFACSILENVCYGLIGTPYEHVTDVEKRELVIEACRQANAWDFIQTLPGGLDTDVGERGLLLSGGQKQRIAIARAIVSNPKILLLDEATSALDTKSEGVVQEALDRASKTRTTIVIAHRLSTIKDADLIVVMRAGEILEQGTHTDLLETKGEYYILVQAQSIEELKETARQSDSGTEKELVDAKSGIELATLGGALTEVTTRKTVASAIFYKTVEVTKPASVGEVIAMIYRISRRELTVLLIGLYSGAITGMAYIGLSILYSTALQNIQQYNNPNDYALLRRSIYAVAGFLFMQAMVLFITSVVSGSMFGYASSRLVRRIRATVFRHLLRQDISYFDDSQHTTGSLTTSLARDAQSIESIGGATANKLVESIVTSFGGYIFCIAFGYKLGLALLSGLPVMLAIGYYRFKFMTNFSETTKSHHTKSSNYACEATSAIRTVVSLTREEEILESYRTTLAVILKGNRIANMKSAALIALGRGMQYYIMALAFYYGGILVAAGEYSLFQFFLIFIIMVFGLENATTIFSFAPEMSKALQAGRNIKKLLDSEPEIDAWSTEGGIIADDEINGEIEFRDVHFRYPTRPDVPVLRGLNLSVKKGQFVALVGASGCGKSTTIGLIESFYRPQLGAVFMDGRDVSTLNVSEYRKNIALVQQEPVLYAGTIRYNVALGSPDTVTDEEIIEACKQANIHNFITSLPDGYDTLCGTKGSLLSGGQKQRIAIARALIRQPKVLLLDEATSALDSESEKVVQAALDVAAKGRTTIAVAHRLSTIQNADVIYVFEEGKILESGTHQQLLANRSKYFDLVQLQALERN